MKQQNSLQQYRSNFLRNQRRQHLQKILSEKRSQISCQLLIQQAQTFKTFLPKINILNYQQYRFNICQYAKSSQYCYEVLGVAFIVVQYLINNHTQDYFSWQILACLSYYQDFQMPQTRQIAHLIIHYLKYGKLLIASQFLVNISKISKFQLLFCRLIDEDLIQVLSQKIYQTQNQYIKHINQSSQQSSIKSDLQYEIWNILQTFSQIFCLQPILQTQKLIKICKIMKISWNYKFLKEIHNQMIIRLIINAIQSFINEYSIGYLLITQFQDKILDFYFIYERQCIKFINYAVNTNISIPLKFLNNLMVTIKSSNSQSKVLAIQILNKIFQTSKEKKIQEKYTQQKNQNTLPSFQQFTSMFSNTKNNNPNQNNLQNLQQIIFSQDYKQILITFLSLYKKSDKVLQYSLTLLIRYFVEFMIQKNASKLTNQPKMDHQADYCLFFTLKCQQFIQFLEITIKSYDNDNALNALQVILQFFQFSNLSSCQIPEIKIFYKNLRQNNAIQSIEHLSYSQNQQIRILCESILKQFDRIQKDIQDCHQIQI